MGAMERKGDLTTQVDTQNNHASREREAQARFLNLGAAEIGPRPWRPAPVPPSVIDLTQYALWRSSKLASDDLLSALSLLPAARGELEQLEVGLLFAARSDGLTWAQIADAMGFRSPQACQQYVHRLSARQDKRA